MKLRHLPLIAAIGLFSTVTLAAGYTGPGATPTTTTVKAALEAADDTPVVLQGTIVKRIKGDIYEFRDATGSMKVEIDDEDFPPMEINDKTRVKLTGEVDRDLVGREIDVEFVYVIKNAPQPNRPASRNRGGPFRVPTGRSCGRAYR